MPFDTHQRVTQQLAGAIGLPAPFPATGGLYVVADDHTVRDPAAVQIEIVHRINYRVRLTRWVALDQVRAIQAPVSQWEGTDAVDESPAPSVPGPGWSMKLPDEFLEAALAKVAAPKKKGRSAGAGPDGPVRAPWLSNAIVYVPEATPVLMQVDVGMTAAESAVYYPPLHQAPKQFFCESERPTWDTTSTSS
jgi:hypothetical protein